MSLQNSSANSKKAYVFGAWRELPSEGWTTDFANEICDVAASKQLSFANQSWTDIETVLEALSKAWSQKNYSFRVRAAEKLPEISGFHQKMIDLALDHFSGLLNPKILRQKIDKEFGGVPRTSDFHFDHEKKCFYHWHPLGSVLHVLSGNVFLVGPSSFLEGIMTGNLTVLKMSSSEDFFMPLFIESLEEVEKSLGLGPIISESLATVSYSSKQKDVMAVFKNRMDAIVIWGGEEAVRSYRNDLPARSRAIVFGPKISYALMTEDGLKKQTPEVAAEKLCQEMIIWDQNACTAPQVAFVEGKENALLVAKELSKKLENAATQLPPGETNANQAAEIQKWRGIAEVSEARNEGLVLADPEGVSWTVIVEDKTTSEKVEIEPSPLHRTIKIIAISSWRKLLNEAEELKSYIQTIGVIANIGEHSEISHEFCRRGALRVMSLGSMNGGDVADPHDGAYDLPQLMNIVTTRLSNIPEGLRPFELLDSHRQSELVKERMKGLIGSLKNTSLYRKTDLDEIKISEPEDWSTLPLLTREELESSMPPMSDALKAETEITGGQITRSGGSTGSAKFSWFSEGDWNEMVKNGVDVFRACGLKRTDRVANFFSCGDLYGSFVSVNSVNEKIGCTSFPFAMSYRAESVAEICKQFGINVLQGIPSQLLKLAREILDLGIEIKFEKILYAGENMSLENKKWFCEKFGVKKISSIIGTTESGIIGYQSNFELENTYTLVPEYNYLEIVDEKGLPVSDENIGRIAVTNLMKRSFPVVRYLIGDQGRFKEVNGKRQFEYLGRADNILSIGKLNIDYDDVENALKSIPHTALQLIGSSQGQKDHLKVALESEPPQKDEALHLLLEKIPKMKKCIDNDFLSVDFEWHQTGTLKRNERTGKLKNIVDLRLE